jgi:hypothetical protein
MSIAQQYPAHSPKTFGQILDRVFRLLRANFKLLVGLAAVPPVVLFALLALVGAPVLLPTLSALPKTPSPQQVLQLALTGVPLMIFVLAVYWLFFALYFAATSYAAVRADQGVRVTFRESYSFAWNHAGRYFLLLFIIYAICFFPALIVQLVMFAGLGLTALNKTQPNPFLIALFPLESALQMAVLVAGFIVALRFSLAFPASVIEDLTAWQAIKRSGILTRGAKGRIFLVLLVIYAATYLAILLLMCGAAVVGAIGFFVWSGMHLHLSTPAIWILAVLAGVAFLSLMVLFMACAWAGYTTALAVLYNDQRMRIDGAPPTIAPNGVPA